MPKTTPRKTASPAPQRVLRTPATAKKTTKKAESFSTADWGDYVPHDHLSKKNIGNAILTALVLVPSLVAVRYLYTQCDQSADDSYMTPLFSMVGLYEQAPTASAMCDFAMTRPVSLANLLFFLNVTVGFWVIGLLQRSFWLIDPYWTILPPLLGHLYQLHPHAVAASSWRSWLTLGLLWVWSARLTHSYFRREEWKFGQREDWRYTKMAKEMPKIWPLVSFFAVGLAQQPMLIGITLPAFTTNFVEVPPPLGSSNAAAQQRASAAALASLPFLLLPLPAFPF